MRRLGTRKFAFLNFRVPSSRVPVEILCSRSPVFLKRRERWERGHAGTQIQEHMPTFGRMYSILVPYTEQKLSQKLPSAEASPCL